MKRCFRAGCDSSGVLALSQIAMAVDWATSHGVRVDLPTERDFFRGIASLIQCYQASASKGQDDIVPRADEARLTELRAIYAAWGRTDAYVAPEILGPAYKRAGHILAEIWAIAALVMQDDQRIDAARLRREAAMLGVTEAPDMPGVTEARTQTVQVMITCPVGAIPSDLQGAISSLRQVEGVEVVMTEAEDSHGALAWHFTRRAEF